MELSPMKKRHPLKWLTEGWQLYVLILPAVVYVFLMNYMPLFGLQIAFKNYRPSLGVWDSPWAGFKYFAQFLNYPNFGLIIANTLRITCREQICFKGHQHVIFFTHGYYSNMTIRLNNVKNGTIFSAGCCC